MDSVELWTSVWSRSSVELRFEVATQIAATSTPSSMAQLITIDDPMLIAELVTIHDGLVDADGEKIDFRSVGRTVTLRLLPEALKELKATPEVRYAIESATAHRAEELAPTLERAVRGAWGNHIKVRTRSRFIVEGMVLMPDQRTALNVLILESSGHTSRELLLVDKETVQSIKAVTNWFEKFPSIILALGAKVEREIWVVPQHATSFSGQSHLL